MSESAEVGKINLERYQYFPFSIICSINGLPLTRSTNNVSDAVNGLNITLKKAGSTSIEVTRSSEIEEKLTAYTTAFNAVQDFIGNQNEFFGLVIFKYKGPLETRF